MVSEFVKKFNIFNDDNFKFDPKKHKYTYNDIELESVTNFIKQFHKPFEKEYIAEKKAEEQGVPKEWIINEWNKLRDYGNYIGSETHKWIENYYNKIWTPLPDDEDIINRINKFNIIYGKHLYKLENIKNEVKIFSLKYKLAGTIDALFLYRNNIYIFDWKTNKRFDTDETILYKERLLSPFQDYYKSHLNEYSLQISLYALILEEWGINVAGGYLVHMGPDEQEPKIYKCRNMKKGLKKFLS